MVARYPLLSHEQSWKGMNYSVQDSMGSRGTVAFGDGRFVALVFDDKSAANPFRSKAPYSVEHVLGSVPPERSELAERASRYLLQNYDGKSVPVITAAFWDGERTVEAAQPWADVVSNGARLLRRQLMPPEEALREWDEYYEMSPAQLDLARALCRRRLDAADGSLPLSDAEWATIVAGSEGDDGLKESRESLGEIGFVAP
jgi:hypothetical protein